MKVFDFTDGVKGDLLGNISLVVATGGWNVEKAGSTYKVRLANPADVQAPSDYASVKWTWHSDAAHNVGGKETPIKPEDFGVGAVCFCAGEFNVYGSGADAEWCWEWNVIGTTAWNRDACKRGILKATKL